MTSKEQSNVLRSHLFVSGPVIVRDATFKDSAQRKARSFGLRGWVRDTQDRRLEILFEGEPEARRRGALTLDVATSLKAYCSKPW